MPRGTFRWFSMQTGCSLIRPDDGRSDLFFHRTGIEGGKAGLLDNGNQVSYELAQQRNGPRATNVSKRRRYSWREDCRERLEGKEVRHDYYARLEESRGEVNRGRAQESRAAYRDFLDSLFFYYRNIRKLKGKSGA